MNKEHRTKNAECRISSHEPPLLTTYRGRRVTRAGFSLTEVLIAVGTLALGMLFIASVFPAGLFWTTVSSERTIAVVVADEAFAKIKLYDLNPVLIPTNTHQLIDIVQLKAGGTIQDANVFAYPSTPTTDPYSKRYWWSAICRRSDPLDPCSVQVTVFVSRKVGTGTKYYMNNPAPPPALKAVDRPVAFFVIVNNGPGSDELTIPVDKTYINDGYTIVDDSTGNVYRVLERYRPPNDNVIRLDKDRQGTINSVWVIPPPVGGGRYPCIAVYQKVMRF